VIGLLAGYYYGMVT